MSAPQKIGFIGLGNMGWPMAANLVKAGHTLTVNDLDAERAGSFAREHNVAAAASNKALAQDCDVVILMTPTSASDDAALSGADGVLAGLRKDALVIAMTSGNPSRTRELALRVTEAGGVLIDAPVSGGVARAKTGELSIMVGADEAEFALAEPLLRAMGTTIVRTGGVATAHAMKALNNLMSAAGFLIGAEALLIGKKFGLDPSTMVDILNNSTGMNNATQRKFKQMVISRKFDGGFGLDLMVKDLGIALSIAQDTGTAAPFSSLCKEMWTAAQASLGPGREHTEMARLSEQLAGVELK